MSNRKREYKNMISGLEIEDYIITATEKETMRMERPLEKKWFGFLWWAIVIALAVLVSRVIFLTVIKGAYYQDVSKGNSIRSIVIKAPRGRIFDKNGTLLVNNVPSIDAVIVPAFIPKDSSEIKKMAEKISNILEMKMSCFVNKLICFPATNTILLHRLW